VLGQAGGGGDPDRLGLLRLQGACQRRERVDLAAVGRAGVERLEGAER
jgi:hypothetical protein